MTHQEKRSKQELIKENSQFLRGTIADDLARESDRFSPDDASVMKFHGTYQQDDRDARKRGTGKPQRSYIVMVRLDRHFTAERSHTPAN